MRLDLGSNVHCTDAAFGELADVIVDPISRRVTHLVVEPHGDHERARLVPIDRARPADDGLALDYSVAEVEALEPLHESAYVRAGELVVADPDWDIGTAGRARPTGLSGTRWHGDRRSIPTRIVMVSYDRIPKHEVEIRRSSAVFSTDGHHLGHVEGFLVGSGETADIVLERGHLWGRREIVIPAAAVERVQNDSSHLEPDQGAGRKAGRPTRPPLVLGHEALAGATPPTPRTSQACWPNRTRTSSLSRPARALAWPRSRSRTGSRFRCRGTSTPESPSRSAAPRSPDRYGAARRC